MPTETNGDVQIPQTRLVRIQNLTTYIRAVVELMWSWYHVNGSVEINHHLLLLSLMTDIQKELRVREPVVEDCDLPF